MEALAVEGDDAGRLLAAMLQRVQAERRQRRGIRMAEDAEHAAFLVQRVAVEIEVRIAARLPCINCRPLITEIGLIRRRRSRCRCWCRRRIAGVAGRCRLGALGHLVGWHCVAVSR